MFKEYTQLDATGLAALIKQKQVSPKEVLESAIHLVEQYNKNLNAITIKHYEMAFANLDNIAFSTPFSGVPFLLKDLGIQFKDTVTSNACKLFVNYKSSNNDEFTKRLIELGLNIFGKTNTPEFGATVVTESELWGTCRNPWNMELTPGGSSGGSAAAVASRIVPMAHASDASGSIRIPASCCGIVGLKPTRGRLPCGPDSGEGWAGLVVNYVLTRSVRDCALMLDEICYPEVGSPYYTIKPEISYSSIINQEPKKLRVAYSYDFIKGIEVHPECRKAVENAAKLCENFGHEVENVSPIWDHEQMVKVNINLICSHFSHIINMIEDQVRLSNASQKNLFKKYAMKFYQFINPHFLDRYFENNTRLFLSGRNLSAIDYCNNLALMHKVARYLGHFFENYDIFISPVTATPAIKVNSLSKRLKSLDDYVHEQLQFAPFTSIYNQTGQPAISLPLHWTSANIPVGVQFASKFGNEDVLLQLARQFEIEQPWAHKMPRIQ